MKLLVTGATGFLGRYVADLAIDRGHEVRAVVRPASEAANLAWYQHPRVELARVDLRCKAGLVEAVCGVDAVVHLAADKTGDFYGQFAANVVATENLLEAMRQANVKRLVAISTFSVYDCLRMRGGAVLDESSPIEKDAPARDDYAQTKLVQEKLIRDHAEEHGLALTVLRPGVIYGRDNLYNAWLGVALSDQLWIRTGAHARLPLTYVENCAEAIVLAAEMRQAVGQVINIVDDDLPTQRRYARELQQRLTPRPRIVPVSWTVTRLTARCAWLTNKLLLGGRAKVPSILIPARLHARGKPLRYSNEKLKETLGWRPRYSMAEALGRSLKDQVAQH